MGITVGFSEWDVLDAKVAFHVGHNAFFAAPTGNWKISSCGYTDLTRAGRKALGGTAVGGRFWGTTAGWDGPLKRSRKEQTFKKNYPTCLPCTVL